MSEFALDQCAEARRTQKFGYVRISEQKTLKKMIFVLLVSDWLIAPQEMKHNDVIWGISKDFLKVRANLYFNF